jgi:hypothetical protein
MTSTTAMLVNVILALIVIEAAVLWRWSGRRAPQSRPALMLVLASGACLVLAVRAAMAGAAVALLAALAAAGIVHMAWLMVSLRRRE